MNSIYLKVNDGTNKDGDNADGDGHHKDHKKHKKHKHKHKNSKEAKGARQKWCQCVIEHGKMVSQEVKTNPRYRDLSM